MRDHARRHASTETGSASLELVANGIASPPVLVNIK